MRNARELLDEFAQNDGDQTEFWASRLPTESASQASLADAFDRVGVDAFNTGDLTLARNAFFALFLLRLELVKNAPSNRAAIRDFATAEDLLGLVSLEIGNLDVASQMLTEAHTYRRGLHQDQPEDSHAAWLYAIALWHMARLDRARGNAKAEADWLQQAVQQVSGLNERLPGVSMFVEKLEEIRQRQRECGEIVQRLV